MSETLKDWTLLVKKLSRAARAKVTFGTFFRRSAALALVAVPLPRDPSHPLKLPRILKKLSRQAHTQSNGADVD